MKENKLLVFDMDETLIHCITKSKESVECDVKIPYSYSKSVKYKHVNLRPYVVEALHELSMFFTIVVFTASTQDYADPILDYLNKDFNFIKKRFYRHHCYRTEDDVSVKDLRIFEQCGYDMKDVVIVDNATHCFGFQVDNGIPILPFINDKNDKEMIQLIYFLKNLANVEDVRSILSSTFKLSKLKDPKILCKIEGVIEYQVEDVSDDLFSDCNKRKSLVSRLTLAEPTSEDVAEENQEQVHFSVLSRSIPKLKSLTSHTFNLQSNRIDTAFREFDQNIHLDDRERYKLQYEKNSIKSAFHYTCPPVSDHLEIKHEKMDSFEDFEIIESDLCDEYVLL